MISFLDIWMKTLSLEQFPLRLDCSLRCLCCWFLIPLFLVHTQLCRHNSIFRNVKGNSFSGTIPTEIGLLSSLTFLCDNSSFYSLTQRPEDSSSFSWTLEVCRKTSSLELFPLNFISLHCLLDTSVSPPILFATTSTTLLGHLIMTTPPRWPFVWLPIVLTTMVPLAPLAHVWPIWHTRPAHQVQVVTDLVLVSLATTDRAVIPVFSLQPPLPASNNPFYSRHYSSDSLLHQREWLDGILASNPVHYLWRFYLCPWLLGFKHHCFVFTRWSHSIVGYQSVPACLLCCWLVRQCIVATDSGRHCWGL